MCKTILAICIKHFFELVLPCFLFYFFLQNKRKICETVSKVFSSVTEALGTFIQEMAAADDSATTSSRRSKRKMAANHEEESAGPSLRRSKRNRTAHHHEDEEDTEEDPDYEED